MPILSRFKIREGSTDRTRKNVQEKICERDKC